MKHFSIYQHFKGGLYTVIAEEVLHTETNEVMVVYSCNASGQVFCRPYEMFHGSVTRPEYTGPRFLKVPYIKDIEQRKALKLI